MHEYPPPTLLAPATTAVPPLARAPLSKGGLGDALPLQRLEVPTRGLQVLPQQHQHGHHLRDQASAAAVISGPQYVLFVPTAVVSSAWSGRCSAVQCSCAGLCVCVQLLGYPAAVLLTKTALVNIIHSDTLLGGSNQSHTDDGCPFPGTARTGDDVVRNKKRLRESQQQWHRVSVILL